MTAAVLHVLGAAASTTSVAAVVFVLTRNRTRWPLLQLPSTANKVIAGLVVVVLLALPSCVFVPLSMRLAKTPGNFLAMLGYSTVTGLGSLVAFAVWWTLRGEVGWIKPIDNRSLLVAIPGGSEVVTLSPGLVRAHRIARPNHLLFLIRGVEQALPVIVPASDAAMQLARGQTVELPLGSLVLGGGARQFYQLVAPYVERELAAADDGLT